MGKRELLLLLPDNKSGCAKIFFQCFTIHVAVCILDDGVFIEPGVEPLLKHLCFHASALSAMYLQSKRFHQSPFMVKAELMLAAISLQSALNR